MNFLLFTDSAFSFKCFVLIEINYISQKGP